MTAIFGLQGAHEKGADEFDALLVKSVKTGRCRLRHMLEAVAGILVEHRTGSAEK